MNEGIPLRYLDWYHGIIFHLKHLKIWCYYLTAIDTISVRSYEAIDHLSSWHVQFSGVYVKLCLVIL